jgi:hypothetical protein
MKLRILLLGGTALFMILGLASCSSLLELVVITERALQDDDMRVRCSQSGTIYSPKGLFLHEKGNGSLASVYGRLQRREDGRVYIVGSNLVVEFQTERPLPNGIVVVRGIWRSKAGIEKLGSSIWFDPYSKESGEGSPFARAAIETIQKRKLDKYSLDDWARDKGITVHRRPWYQ